MQHMLITIDIQSYEAILYNLQVAAISYVKEEKEG